jgi:hypothetical protein
VRRPGMQFEGAFNALPAGQRENRYELKVVALPAGQRHGHPVRCPRSGDRASRRPGMSFGTQYRVTS